MRIKINADTRPIANFLKEASQKLSDLQGFLRTSVAPLIADYTRRVFDTRGYGSWGRSSLYKTGRLFRSYTQPRSADNIAETTKNSLIYGSKVFYARFHEDGTRNLQQRQVIGKVDRHALTDEITTRLSNHIDAVMEKL